MAGAVEEGGEGLDRGEMIEQVLDGGAGGVELVGTEGERQAGVRRRQQDVAAGEELRDRAGDEVVVLFGGDEMGGGQGLAGDVGRPARRLQNSVRWGHGRRTARWRR